MTSNQTFNTFTRLLLYLILIYLIIDLISQDNPTWGRYAGYFVLGFVAALILLQILLRKNDNKVAPVYQSRVPIQEPLTFHSRSSDDFNSRYRVPTRDNPYMNPTLSDSRLIPADDLTRHESRNHNPATRSYYTVPVNDQQRFAEWAYGMPETCKENPSKCGYHEDLRYAKYNPAVDDLDI